MVVMVVMVVAVVVGDEEGASTIETIVKAAVAKREITVVKPEAATELIETTLVKPEEAIDFIDITVVKPEAAAETTASAIEATAPVCHLC